MSEVATIEEKNNSLTLLANSFGFAAQVGTQLSQSTTLILDTSNELITNNYILLSQAYVKHGLIQTLIDQPVEDAFRPWFDIKTGQLDPEEIDQLNIFLEEKNVITSLMQAIKWGRLLGGGAVILITPQKPSEPLDLGKIKLGQPIEFRAVDQVELYTEQPLGAGQMSVGENYGELTGDYFMYYGVRVHKSRVLMFKGKEAPSRVRARMRGWGLSEVERLVRSLNQYMKNGNLVFELMDEAKIDIFKMEGFNQALGTITGTELVSKRIQHANTIKNYNNALTMDKTDDYEQKQISFSGLSEVLEQIRYGIAADMKMPMTKLFGMSPGGLNSTGEHDLENYNAMVESEVRAKVKFHVIELLKISCQYLFGHIPDDLMIKWHPLRIVSPEEQEKVKDYQFKRVTTALSGGIMAPLEAKQAINKEALLPVEIKETNDLLPTAAELEAKAAGKNQKDKPSNK